MTMLHRLCVCFALICVTLSGYASETLGPNTVLLPGDSITSPNGKYVLILQGDGNLVYYRTDGAVRFATYAAGNQVVMQGDGNFVEYNSGNPVFNTQTAGNPGAFLSAQDDGNLVVYSANSVPLWNIGVDTDLSASTTPSSFKGIRFTPGYIPPNPDPTQIGDVVGRDLAVTGFGFIGHLGIWDGNQIIQAGPNGTPNTIHYDSLTTFKAATSFWGTAHPNIPNYQIQDCYATSCNYIAYQGPDPRTQTSTTTRIAIAKRTYQIYLIGADYTVLPTYSEALPAKYVSGGFLNGSTRGLYRCDTFVIAALRASLNTNISNTDMQLWISRWNNLYSGAHTPDTVFAKVRSFN